MERSDANAVAFRLVNCLKNEGEEGYYDLQRMASIRLQQFRKKYPLSNEQFEDNLCRILLKVLKKSQYYIELYENSNNQYRSLILLKALWTTIENELLQIRNEIDKVKEIFVETENFDNININDTFLETLELSSSDDWFPDSIETVSLVRNTYNDFKEMITTMSKESKVIFTYHYLRSLNKDFVLPGNINQNTIHKRTSRLRAFLKEGIRKHNITLTELRLLFRSARFMSALVREIALNITDKEFQQHVLTFLPRSNNAATERGV